MKLELVSCVDMVFDMERNDGWIIDLELSV